MRTLALVSLLAVALSACSKKKSAGDKAKPEAMIDVLLKAVEAKDVKALAATFPPILSVKVEDQAKAKPGSLNWDELQRGLRQGKKAREAGKLKIERRALEGDEAQYGDEGIKVEWDCVDLAWCWIDLVKSGDTYYVVDIDIFERGGDTFEGKKIIPTLEDYRDEMCACTDKDCATKVHAEYAKWVPTVADTKGTEAQQAQVRHLASVYMGCFKETAGPIIP